jgi:hypothetical protein
MTAIRVIFDGKTFVPQEPIELPAQSEAVVLIDSANNRQTAFHPVGDWDGPPGEFDRLMDEVRAARDADIEVEREARP